MSGHVAMLVGAQKRAFEDRQVDQDTVESFPLAGLILASLAIEIGLKAIICRDNGLSSPKELAAWLRAKGAATPSGHNLSFLFNQLTADQRGFLSTKVVTQIPAIQEFLIADDGSGPSEIDLRPVGNTIAVQAELEAAEKIFETWRYVYEHGFVKTNVSFLQTFARAVEDLLAKPPPAQTPSAPSPASAEP